MAEDSSQQPASKRPKFINTIASSPKTPLTDDNRYDFSQSFDVLVGAEKKRFTVIHDVLASRSGFFEAARSPRWKLDPSIPTDLSDHDPQVFSDYLKLVYTGTLTCPNAKLSQWYNDGFHEDTWSEVCKAHEEDLLRLAKLYSFADMLEDLVSANLIVDNFLLSHGAGSDVLPLSVVTWIYEHTPPISPLRQVVRDVMLHETNEDYFANKKEDELPNALLLEMMQEHKQVRKRRSSWQVFEAYPYYILDCRSKCHYHQHNDKHPKCK